MDYRQKLFAERTGLRGLIAKIPGFKGYSNKELRREADKLLRTHLAQGFQVQRNRLSELQVDLVGRKQLAAVGQIEKAVTKATRLIDRLKTASYGYAGWFDAAAVKEEELDLLYDFDAALASGVEQLGQAIDALAAASAAGESLDQRISVVSGLLEAINQTVDERSRVVYGK